MYLYNVLINKSMEFLTKHMTIDESQIPVVKYGLEVILINFFKSIILFIIALHVGLLKETVIFVLCFASIRLFAAGVHATSTLVCTLVNLLIFIGGSYISIVFPLNMMAISIFFAISFCLIFLYAPSDTKSKPIVSKSLRKKLKIKALLMAFILFLFVLFLKDIVYKNIITYAVLTESLCLTPILYKFLGKEYNNYEKFKSTTT